MADGADWIAVDWGTSNLRLWAMDAEDRVITTRSSDHGMGTLTPNQFEPVLLDLCSGHLSSDRVTPVVICGMAGARQGWAEAPYLPVPVTLDTLGGGGRMPSLKASHISVRILPGLSQDYPADVMRGEETQIAGYCAQSPGFDGTLCLPGTHSKWARVSDGTISEFRTALTGELFALLSEKSVLRHSLNTTEHDANAFSEGVSDALERPEALTVGLFALRAEALLRDATPAAGRARLSGLLIGQELAGTRAFWQGRETAVIGAGPLAALYVQAIAIAGGSAQQADGSGLALAGLTAAHRLTDTF